MNYTMFPGDNTMLEALKSWIFVNTELFMTETCKYGHCTPACSIAERNEIKVYRGGYASYIKPIIKPLYESKSDAQIIQEMAIALKLNDSLLIQGYDAWCDYIFRDTGVTIEQLKESDKPIRVPAAVPYEERVFTREGYDTPTGKFELLSTIIEKLPKEFGLDPLPTYKDSLDESDSQRYPFILFTGTSLPNAYSERLNKLVH